MLKATYSIVAWQVKGDLPTPDPPINSIYSYFYRMKNGAQYP